MSPQLLHQLGVALLHLLGQLLSRLNNRELKRSDLKLMLRRFPLPLPLPFPFSSSLPLPPQIPNLQYAIPPFPLPSDLLTFVISNSFNLSFQKGVSKSVKVFVGMTKGEVGLMDMISLKNDKKVAYSVEQIFLHPKLQTSEVGLSVLHSHWSRYYEARLSLVESFRVLLGPEILCHKEPSQHI